MISRSRPRRSDWGENCSDICGHLAHISVRLHKPTEQLRETTNLQFDPYPASRKPKKCVQLPATATGTVRSLSDERSAEPLCKNGRELLLECKFSCTHSGL